MPLQARALDAIDRIKDGNGSPLLFPGERGELARYPSLPTVPLAAGAEGGEHLAASAVYDLGHTFATFALRAGISTFDLSRYIGASLTMIDRHYGPSPATDASTRSSSSTR